MAHEPREFSCMDDSPMNNGWGYNSEPRYREEPEPEETEPDFDDISEEGTFTVVNKGDWSNINDVELGTE